MKTAHRSTNLRPVFCTALVFCLVATGLPAQEIQSMDHLILRQNKVFLEQGGQSKPLDKEMTLSDGTKVQTNGIVTLPGGVEKELPENRPFTLDGFLLTSDGLFVRLQDHVTLRNGALYMVKNGQASPISRELTLGDGTVVMPDGVALRPDGRRLRLLDGHMLKLDGTHLQTLDQVLWRNGQIVLQKDGSLLRLDSGRTLVMSDGTKVKGDGTIHFPDGRQILLQTGQRLTLAGAVLPKAR